MQIISTSRSLHESFESEICTQKQQANTYICVKYGNKPLYTEASFAKDYSCQWTSLSVANDALFLRLV
jgi:hypothetical protein